MHASNVAGTVAAMRPSPGIAAMPCSRHHSMVARRGATPWPLIAIGFGSERSGEWW